MKTINADLLLKELNRRSEEINDVIDYADVAEFELERLRKFILSNVSDSNQWTCNKCGPVPNEEVTFEETHDGCGGYCCTIT